MATIPDFKAGIGYNLRCNCPSRHRISTCYLRVFLWIHVRINKAKSSISWLGTELHFLCFPQESLHHLFRICLVSVCKLYLSILRLETLEVKSFCLVCPFSSEQDNAFSLPQARASFLGVSSFAFYRHSRSPSPTFGTEP